MQQYSIESLTKMIVDNNLAAIHARLLLENRVSGTALPSVEALSFAINQQMEQLPPADFYNWLETLFDVPVDPRGAFANDLTAIRQLTGKSPAKLLVDMQRQADGNSTDIAAGITGILSARTPWWVWLLLFFALLGAITSLVAAVKIVRKALN